MKKKGTLRLAVALLGRYLVGSVIALLLDLSVMMFLNNPFGRAACQLLCFSAAFSLVYLCAWQTGDHDKNSVEFGRMRRDPAKGFRAGAVAMLIPIALNILLPIARISGTMDGFLYFYRFINPVFMPLNYSLLPATLLLSEIGLFPILLSCCMPLIFILLSGLGYALGLRGVHAVKALGVQIGRQKAE